VKVVEQKQEQTTSTENGSKIPTTLEVEEACEHIPDLIKKMTRVNNEFGAVKFHLGEKGDIILSGIKAVLTPSESQPPPSQAEIVNACKKFPELFESCKELKKQNDEMIALLKQVYTIIHAASAIINK